MTFTALAVSAKLLAAVALGENLIVNGRFETDQTEWPIGWGMGASREGVEYLPAGGPGGIPAMRWKNESTTKRAASAYRQGGGMCLAPDGTYRISGWVRTRNFSGSANLIVINAGWEKAGGITNIPNGTCDWKKFESTFKCFPSSDKRHEVVISLTKYSGEIDFADLKLEALDAPALAGTERQVGGIAGRAPRLVPWRPLLCAIPENDRTVEFRFFGKLPKDGAFERYELRIRADGAAEFRQPLVKGSNLVTLPAEAKGGHLAVEVVEKGEKGERICDGVFAYRVVPPARPADESKHVKLNGLVTRLLRERLVATDEAQTFSFSRKGDGWIFLQVKALGETPNLKVALDGKIVLDARYPRLETFRRIAAGSHEVKVFGCSEEGGIRVHAIPEIFNYCTENSVVKENPDFDWPFQERHVLTAVTTLDGGSIPPPERAWFVERGYNWMGNMSAGGLTNETVLASRLAASSYMKGFPYAGVSLDEVNLGDDKRVTTMTSNLRYCEKVGLGGLGGRGEKGAGNQQPTANIYVWVYGKPLNPILSADFMSACVNAAEGRGRMLFEAYPVTRENEELAKAFLTTGFRDAMVRFRETYPLSIPNTGVIFGNFMQYPRLSLVHHPSVDFKYYLDMQLHMLATDPVFDGIGTVGYWGSYYIDEEHLRWSFALMRHYFVEGRTDRLSERYGYAYCPGFVRNPDFEEGLDGWTVSGDVTTGRHSGFGRLSQGRWSSGATPGDTYAVLKRGEKESVLSQKIAGLTPGKLYRLELMVADADDVEQNRVNGRRLPVDVALEGGARQGKLSWVHVATKPRYDKKQTAACVNLHHVIFRANGGEATVRIFDRAAQPGARHAVNAVLLCPYYE